MTTKDQLTQQQWDILIHAPLGVWLGVSGCDPFVGSLEREFEAFGEAARLLAQRYGENELVVTVLAVAARPTEAQRKGRATVDLAEVLAGLRRVGEVLGSLPAQQEAAGFKRCLLDFGDKIARATSEAVVDTRATVSQAEEDFLRKARAALG